MLQKIGFLPGFNKQVTPTGAEGQWTDGENVRFRYLAPEKIGGWQQLGESKLTGVARGLHHWVNSSQIKYAAIGTNRILYVYSGGIFYDIHPLVNPSGADTNNAFSTVNGSKTVTVTVGPHTFQAGDIIKFGETITPPTGSSFTAASFANLKFMVTSVVSATVITITMSAAESTATVNNSGAATFFQYYHVGPAEQLGAFGWGISLFGGNILGAKTTTLNGALGDNTSGTGSSGTSVTLTSVAGLPTSGTNSITVGTVGNNSSEVITYTGVSGNNLTGITRAAFGSTRSAHSNGAAVTNSSSFTGWGSPAANTDSVIDPGLWALDNLGSKLIALIVGGKCFEWDADASNAASTRATVITNAPVASNDMLVSTPDRHLVFFGTTTDNTDASTQDEMFLQFSDQENINDYTPTANNSAGSQKLADGSRIMGALRGRNAIYVWTDTALFIMRFVGQPFTFAFEQVGVNCGLIGMNAAIEVDGTAYWMSENGFFRYTGKLESMVCLVEDYVFDDLNTTSSQLVYASLNNLFGEVMWFYPTSTSNVNNRCVLYNYLDSTQQRPIWFTNANQFFPRTTWQDSAVFGLPHATDYDAGNDASFDVIGNTDGTTIYYEHETGTDQVTPQATTTLTSSILSGDFDITQDQREGITFKGDGEFIMRISRIVPDFISQTGNTVVELDVRNYPNDSAVSSTLGPFTISSSTDKIDTRARGRAIALKISNTAASQSWKLGTFRLDVHPDGRR